MRRRAHRHPGRLPRSGAGPPDPLGTRAMDVQHRHDAAEVAAGVRCPRCRTPLVARMGRHGPCFPCRCPGWTPDAVRTGRPRAT
jgi:hypothetical protein